MKKYYSWKKFEKVIGIQSNWWMTYIINGFVYVLTDKGYERMNSKALDYKGILEIEQLAREKDQGVLVVFKGWNHKEKERNYLEYAPNL